MPGPHEPLPVRLKRLRQKRKLSHDRIARLSVGYDGTGVSSETVKKLEVVKVKGTPVRPRQAEPKTMEAIVYALNVESPDHAPVAPTDFPEYRLAVARRALDENQVGIETALLNLERTQPTQAPGPTDEELAAHVDALREAGQQLTETRESTAETSPPRKRRRGGGT